MKKEVYTFLTYQNKYALKWEQKMLILEFGCFFLSSFHSKYGGEKQGLRKERN